MSTIFATATAADLTRLSKQPDLQNVVSIGPKTSLQDTLDLLAQHNILAVPVWNSDSKAFEGIISMYEIMSYIAWASWNGENPERLTADNFSQVTDAHVYLEAAAADILGSSGVEVNDARKGLWVIKGGDSIKQLFELLSKGVYRAIVEVEGAARIVSQSDLVKFIQLNKDRFGISSQTSVAEAGLGSKKVFSVRESDNALFAFRELRLKEVQGFAVVDANGHLVGNFSASDMRGMKKSDLSLLGLSVGAFLRNRNPSGTLKSPITVKLSDTLAMVLDTFVSSRVHRLFVVDEGRKPTAVISLTDVILLYFTANLSVFYPPVPEGEA